MWNSSTLPIDRTLSGVITPSQSRSGTDGNEGILRILQSSSNTGTSPSDCFVSYPEYSLVVVVGFLPYWGESKVCSAYDSGGLSRVKIPAEVGSIVVTGVLTRILLHSFCDLKTAQINVQCCQIRRSSNSVLWKQAKQLYKHQNSYMKIKQLYEKQNCNMKIK